MKILIFLITFLCTDGLSCSPKQTAAVKPKTTTQNFDIVPSNVLFVLN